ncbi:MAG TPA: helix-turn-helix domain-containing protein, partial [Anaerolineaceae bacterium]|nr:helix-turn-helix domain-containing protein [Anaerolineaceae bacterium]
ALRLFGQYGLDGTTMEQIAEETDIAKGTLYHYFPVKEAILDAYIQQTFREKNAERIQQLRGLADTRARMVFILNDLMQGVQRQKVIFERYFIYRIQNMISLSHEENTASGFSAMGEEIIRLGQQSGELRGDLPIELLEALFEFVFIKVAQQFYAQPDDTDFGIIIQQYVDIFLRGAQA